MILREFLALYSFEKQQNPPSSPFSKGGKSGIFQRTPKSSPPFKKGRTGGISGKVFSKRKRVRRNSYILPSAILVVIPVKGGI
jgi:hypothetical protein